MKKKNSLLGILAAILLILGYVTGVIPGGEEIQGRDYAVVEAATQQGAIIAPEDIAAYLFAHGELPENFITKQEARALGWDSEENYLSDVAPGKSIGGDRFGNYEGLLPKKSGRTYYEADCNYVSGPRGAERIVYSSDGLVYYTGDHYESFTQIEP